MTPQVLSCFAVPGFPHHPSRFRPILETLQVTCGLVQISAIRLPHMPAHSFAWNAVIWLSDGLTSPPGHGELHFWAWFPH